MARGGYSLHHMGLFVAVHRLSTWGARAPKHLGSVVGMQGLSCRSMWDLSSLTKDWTHVPCTARQILNHWTIREVSRPILSETRIWFPHALTWYLSPLWVWNLTCYRPRSHGRFMMLLAAVVHERIFKEVASTPVRLWPPFQVKYDVSSSCFIY